MELRLIDRFLNDWELSKALQEISDPSSVRRIQLRGNVCSEASAHALQELLQSSGSIKELSLEWNQISSNECAILAMGLQGNGSITAVDLRNNEINDDGAIALAKAVFANHSLVSLDLRWNKITDNGAYAFKDCLLHRQPQLALSISGNLLSEVAMATLSQWQSNPIPQPQSQPLDTIGPFLDSLIPLDRPSDDELTLRAQNELYQKEIAELKGRLLASQDRFADYQRQLDSSAIRITELEQRQRRDEFLIAELTERVRQLTESLSLAAEEKRGLLAAWTLEKTELLTEHRRMLLEKDSSILLLTNEVQSRNERLQRAEHDIDRLTQQLQQLLEAITDEREQYQSKLHVSLGQITALEIAQSRLSTELERLQQEYSSLQATLTAKEESHIQRVAELQSLHSEEINRLRVGLARELGEAAERLGRVLEEKEGLQRTADELELQLLTQANEMKERHDREFTELRQTEKQRYEEMEKALLNRIASLTVNARESDNRYQELSQHMQRHVADSDSHSQMVDDRNRQLEAEVRTRQSELLALHDSHSKLTQENHRLKLDNSQLQQEAVELNKSQLQNSQANQLLLTDKESLSRNLLSVERALEREKLARQADFAVFSEHILSSVQNEVNILRDRLSKS